jgi:cell division protein ZapA (FtsZ GTPase activity inhibitor)
MKTVEAINLFDEYNKLKAENDRLREENYDLTLTFLLSKEKADDEIERLREALQSISNNTCCDNCQEAALVARAALKEKE